MTLSTRTTTGQSRYTAAAEWDAVFGTIHTWRGERDPLLWCHGNGGTTLADYTTYNAVLHGFAQTHGVMVADLGGNTFGNDTGIARVGDALDHLEFEWAMAGPVVLVGASMGAAVALNYALRFPERVAAVACVIPALDLASVDAGNPAKPNLDLAYPPAYDDDNPEHAAHNPARFVTDLPAGMPIALWTSSNDPVALSETADAFVAARPQTERFDLGPQGHGGIQLAGPLMAAWIDALE